ncbi:MAG: alanine racemase [Acidobacteria bacterium]|nr:MAG: alanine racemase [Acidobacteriota bacterium]RLE34302.1 MAG: alanine racemase [Acidobacteriota bacterium]
MSLLTLDPEALANNLSLARKWAPSGARVRAMVKADAYGHGVEPLIEVFANNADELGVATLEEGLQIRSYLKDDFPVFVMSRAKDWGDPDSIATLRKAALIPAISSLDELRLLVDQLEGAAPFPVELKLDTGMGRLGIQKLELPDVISIIRSTPSLRVVGILTHFASSDEQDLGPTLDQEMNFRRMVSQFPDDILLDASIHSCNSGALLQRGLGRTDVGSGTHVVRPGVMLYGAAPSRMLHDSPAGKCLAPVGRWTTRVLEVRTMAPGAPVGYGGTWKVEGQNSVRVAVLAIGYADGFRRSLGNRGRVLIRGGAFPIVGRVSMDLISVLVDDKIRVGDEAVLLGAQQGELGSNTIEAWELSELCDTIPYEIWTSIGRRVERVLGT